MRPITGVLAPERHEDRDPFPRPQVRSAAPRVSSAAGASREAYKIENESVPARSPRRRRPREPGRHTRRQELPSRIVGAGREIRSLNRQPPPREWS